METGGGSVNSWQREWERLPFTFMVVGGALVAAALLGNLIAPQKADPMAPQIRQHTTQILALTSEIARLQKEVQALRGTPDSTAVGAQVASLAVAIGDVRQRQARLEAAIMDDPARALQVPLLRRDLDNVVSHQVRQTESQQREFERLYQLFISLFAALAVSIFAPGLLGMWKDRATPDRTADDSKSVEN